MLSYPEQQVSRSKKEEDSFYKPTYDYLISKAISLNPKDELTTWLDAANGIISNASLKYLISPLKDKETEQVLNKLPGEIRDTDLINTVRERNIGEYIGIPYKFTVNVLNADSILKRDAAVAEEVNKAMQQGLINLLNEYYEKQQEVGQAEGAINTGLPSKDFPDIEKFAKEFIENWIDDRAIKGFNILKLINVVNDFDTKRIQAFFYWWATEEFYTYREIINNEVYTSVLSPFESYPIYNDEQFVEDYTGFLIKKKTTLSKVKAMYWNEFSNSERDHIANLTRDGQGKYSTKGTWLASRSWDASETNNYSANSNMDYDVTDTYEALDEYTIIWRTEVPIKIRKFIDPLGIEREEPVIEDYEETELDLEVRTEWIEEVYIGKRFGNAITGVYLKPKPCDVQRYDEHTLTPKLPVGGKKGILRNIKQNPIPKRLLPYVLIDRMILLQQERVIAKYEGYIKVIPQALLNDDITGTKKEKLFYIKADNTLVYDDTTIDFNTVAQGFRVVAMPDVANYLKTLIDLRDKYKAEGLEIANMNNYALGDVMASTGKSVMQESIYRAKVGNVLSITMFHAALERDHTADLEFSKVAYHDEKRGSYTDRASGKPIYVDINIEEHRETQYGCFVENSKLDEAKLEMLRQIGFNASQNGDIDSAITAIEGDSIPEVRKALKEISKANKELEERMAENQNATQRYVADMQDKINTDKNETTKYVADKNSETAITVAEMKTDNTYTPDEVDINTDGEESKAGLQRDQLEFKRNDANEKNNLKRQQMRATEKANAEKLKLAKSKPNNKS